MLDSVLFEDAQLTQPHHPHLRVSNRPECHASQTHIQVLKEHIQARHQDQYRLKKPDVNTVITSQRCSRLAAYRSPQHYHATLPLPRRHSQPCVVEPVGIEPTTSSLQSWRSPS